MQTTTRSGNGRGRPLKNLSGAAKAAQDKRTEQVRNATLEADTAPESMYGSYTWLNVNEIHIDERYQRALKPESVDRIVRTYDPKLFQPLTVSLREDNKYYAIDGQHRLFAAKALGLATVPVILHLDMTEAQEAEHFVSLQEKRVALMSHQKFGAQILSGNAEAIAVRDVMKKHGFEMVAGNSATTHTRHNVFVGAKTLLEAYRVDAGKYLSVTLEIIRLAFPDDENNTRIILIKSVMHFVRTYGRDKNFQRDRLVMRLRRMAVRDFTSRASARGSTLRTAGHIAGSQVLQEMHDEGLRQDKRLWTAN